MSIISSIKEFMKEFMDNLMELFDKPPYLMFFFVSSVFLMVSLIWQGKYFEIFFILLIYSMFGVVWRHATKDVRGRIQESCKNNLEKFNKKNLLLTTVYQVINLILIVALIIVLFHILVAVPNSLTISNFILNS